MAPKKNTAAVASVNQPGRPFQNFYVVDKVWNGYWETTSHQTLLIDAFLAFLLVVGALQALYFLAFSHDVSYPIDHIGVLLGHDGTKRTDDIMLPTALQRLSCRLHCHCWSIRLGWYVSPCAPPPQPSTSWSKANCADDRYSTVSLRMQTDPRNKAEFPKTTPER